jgi:methylenetetrahydrofolate reductase (NADPH)
MPSFAPSFSFEFFPPKTEKSALDLDQAALALAALNPSFMTVTYGAGGSTRDGTYDTVTRLHGMTTIPMAAHLTFCGTPKPELDVYIDKLWDAGIHHLIALRGDLPAGKSMADYTGPEFYHYTSDFVEALLKRHPFEISVGAYPEKHPDAPSLALDIEALKKKCNAGASRAITQLFFSNDIFYKFIDETAKAGIITPIVPGLLPIADFEKTLKFATTCRATVPQTLHRRFAGLTPEDTAKVAVEVLAEQIQDLAKHGVKHFHFYTLNKSELCMAACKAAGLISDLATPLSFPA